MSSEVIVPDSESMKKLKNMIEECVDHLTHIDALRDKIKDIKKEAKEEFAKVGVDAKKFNQMVALVHRGNARQKNDELTDVLDYLEAMGYYSH